MEIERERGKEEKENRSETHTHTQKETNHPHSPVSNCIAICALNTHTNNADDASPPPCSPGDGWVDLKAWYSTPWTEKLPPISRCDPNEHAVTSQPTLTQQPPGRPRLEEEGEETSGRELRGHIIRIPEERPKKRGPEYGFVGSSRTYYQGCDDVC